MRGGGYGGGYRSVGALAQLLELLERAGVSFAVHVCRRVWVYEGTTAGNGWIGVGARRVDGEAGIRGEFRDGGIAMVKEDVAYGGCFAKGRECVSSGGRGDGWWRLGPVRSRV